jgi:membrane protease YdiL (CAAX protease family)
VKSYLKAMLALLEVIAVRFVLIPLTTMGINRLFPGFESWQTETLGFAFPVFNSFLFMVFAVILVWIHGGDFKAYGFVFTPLKYHLDVFATCFLPFVLSSMPLGFGLDHTTWRGALVLVPVKLALLAVVVLMLRKKPTLAAGASAAVLVLIRPESLNLASPIGKALAVFLTYAVFVGFGEEIIYRGYIQSCLNAAFGKPYQVFGVSFGWGLLLSSALFGLSHVGIVSGLLGQTTALTWAWGAWTFAGGLVYGSIREKTGSILAPALLHGLPQAIASVAMLIL